jgi:hypothetical protein
LGKFCSISTGRNLRSLVQMCRETFCFFSETSPLFSKKARLEKSTEKARYFDRYSLQLINFAFFKAAFNYEFRI